MQINLKQIPHSSGVYYFISNNEIIYVGSSNNLYKRLSYHNENIRKGSNHGCQTDLYQFLQSNPFTIEFQLSNNYRQLEQELIEKHQPKYNSHRANTGISQYGNEAEYKKKYYYKYHDDFLKYHRQYNNEHKEQKKQYHNQLCNYNGETLTLNALRKRFAKSGIEHPTAEAKKYLIK